MPRLRVVMVCGLAAVCPAAFLAAAAAAEPMGRDGSQPGVLPALEALRADSDFTVFMAPEVPDEVRNLALRRLWRLLAWQSDGLDTYAGDYTSQAGRREAGAVALKILGAGD